MARRAGTHLMAAAGRDSALRAINRGGNLARLGGAAPCWEWRSVALCGRHVGSGGACTVWPPCWEWRSVARGDRSGFPRRSAPLGGQFPARISFVV